MNENASKLQRGYNLIKNLKSVTNTKTGLLVAKENDEAPVVCFVGNKKSYRMLDLKNLSSECGEWCVDNLEKSQISSIEKTKVDGSSCNSVFSKNFYLAGMDVNTILHELSDCEKLKNASVTPYEFNCLGPNGSANIDIAPQKCTNFIGCLVVVFNSRCMGGEITIPGHCISFSEFSDPKVIAKVIFVPLHTHYNFYEVERGHRLSVVYTVHQQFGNATTYHAVSVTPTFENEFAKPIKVALDSFSEWLVGKKNVYVSSWIVESTKGLLLKLDNKFEKVTEVKDGGMCYKMREDWELKSVFLEQEIVFTPELWDPSKRYKVKWNLVPPEFEKEKSEYVHKYICYYSCDYFSMWDEEDNYDEEQVSCAYGYLFNPIKVNDEEYARIEERLKKKRRGK